MKRGNAGGSRTSNHVMNCCMVVAPAPGPNMAPLPAPCCTCQENCKELLQCDVVVTSCVGPLKLEQPKFNFAQYSALSHIYTQSYKPYYIRYSIPNAGAFIPLAIRYNCVGNTVRINNYSIIDSGEHLF